MANCSGISQGQDVDCLDPLFVGIEKQVFLANLDDVELITFSAVQGTTNVIEGITMKSGKAFFQFNGVAQSIKARHEFVRGDLNVSYKHIIDLSVFEVDNLSLENVEAMGYKNQIAIIFQPDDSSLGNGALTVWGQNIGMELLTSARDLSDNSTGGADTIQLSTPDNGGSESKKPAPFFITDYATTRAAIELLLTPAV